MGNIEEHEALRAEIREWAEREIKPIAFTLDKNSEFPREQIQDFAKRGFMGLPYPKEYGGMGKDILSYAGANKKDNQILVGFAAETNNMEEYAKQKLEKKNADIIAANDVSRKDIGFNSMDNEVTLFFADGHITHTGRQSKQDIAKIILAESAILHSEKNQ